MMLTRKCFFLFFLIGIFQASTAQKIADRRIARKIKKIEAFQGATIGLSIRPLKGNGKEVAFNEHRYMTPASNTKLLTFLAAIETFDSLPAIRFHKTSSGITHIKTTGYPNLFHPFYEDTLLSKFLEKQKSIVYHPITNGYERFGPGWAWDDFSFYFSAEKSPFPIYGNVIEVIKDFSKDKIQLNPAFFNANFKRNTSSSPFRRMEFKNEFYGNAAKWNTTDTLYRPFITSDSLFVSLLSKKLGVPVEIASNQSLDSIVWEAFYSRQEQLLFKALLQDSDNLIAESLLQMIALKRTKSMDVQQTINLFLSEWEIFLPDSLEWTDGSGLSRYNMVTPRSLIVILAKIYERIGWEGVQTYFPKSGTSGTLKSNYTDNVAFYAKTGTLRHNHNLSGFLQNKKGGVFVFSLMVNHYTAPTSEVQKGMESLLKYFREKS